MVTINLIEIGERIRKRRTELGYTQQYVYEKLDISHNHYSRIENGHVGMSFELLLQLGEILGLTADYILTGRISSEDSCEFITAYNRLTSKQKDYIEKHIQLFDKYDFN